MNCDLKLKFICEQSFICQTQIPILVRMRPNLSDFNFGILKTSRYIFVVYFRNIFRIFIPDTFYRNY